MRGMSVVPTRVGVDRTTGHAIGRRRLRRPHTRGGGPSRASSSARAVSVVPTRVGVDRTRTRPQSVTRCVVPTRVGVDRSDASSATARRCVVPTRVGVDRCSRSCHDRACGRPHMRGGGPRTYRSDSAARGVVPTCVGVDRARRSCRASGCQASSPHAWGWTAVCSGPGDASATSSPHAWGWTVQRTISASSDGRDVVPTCVGVDRRSSPTARRHPSVVPTCVGVDRQGVRLRPGVVPTSSPHAWGWTANDRRHAASTQVVPTCVGVDRSTTGPTSV